MRYIAYGTVGYDLLPAGHRQVVAVAAFLPDRRVLLVQREGRRGWELPGGRVASGEKPADAAARELVRRLGGKAPELVCHGVVLTTWRDEAVAAHLFSCCVQEPGNGTPFSSPPPDLYFPQQREWIQRLRRDLDLRVRELPAGEAPPLNLLLLADPSPDLIQWYLPRSRCFVAELDGAVVGAGVLLPTRPATFEVINLAVHPGAQGGGVGTRLMLSLLATARAAGVRYVMVGVRNSSVRQLAFYQRFGFRITGVERDYFRRFYQEPFLESGVPCLDMVRLALEL